MSITQLAPYLHFNGNAKQAIALYQEALGAKVDMLKPMGEAPGMDIPADQRDRVMHCSLRIDGQPFFLSDSMPGREPKVGENVQICLNFGDASDMQKRFDALARGGTVTFALHDTFWGAKFGMLTDAFGIRWMFNCEQKQG